MTAADRALLDPGIAPWIERLNAMPHVTTWQSCSGHPAGERSATGERYPNGHDGVLWVTLTPGAHEAMLARAGEIAYVEPIQQVSLLYGRERFPVWEIGFLGRAHGREQESYAAIEAFLRSLEFAALLDALADAGVRRPAGRVGRPVALMGV